MATWAKEIMKLANDFCLNTEKVRTIISETDRLTVPQDRTESEYKYSKAHLRLKSMIMNM